MKTLDYVRKYKLNESDKFDHAEFVKDLTSDLLVLLEVNKALDNIKGFDNAVNCIRMKYDAINNKTVGFIPDKLWSFFWATVVVKLREQLCPKDVAKRREMAEERKREWEERKKMKQWEDEALNEYFWANIFGNFLSAKQTQNPIPTDSFRILNLDENATEEQVKAVYRQLSKIHHPDNGGKQDRFIEITESKNKVLLYIQNSTFKINSSLS